MLRVENLLKEELERNISNSSKETGKSNWKRILRREFNLDKRVIEMSMLKEVIHILSRKEFNDVSRGEIRKEASGRNLFYYIIFYKEYLLAFACIINILELGHKIDSSKGVIHAIRYQIINNERAIDYEHASFINYEIEVKNYIEIIGNLYRKARKF
jgi:hypothetical protein